MGNAVSSTSQLAPISFASTILSFITFTTTFLTFLSTFWSDFRTATNAASEIHDILGGLGIALHEERSILRKLRRRCSRKVRARRFEASASGGDKSELARRSSRRERNVEEIEDEAVWRSLENSIRGMCRTWEGIEVHFRPDAVSGSPDEDEYAQRRRWSEVEKGREEMEVQIEQGRRYAGMSMGRRWLWVRVKSNVVKLSEGLSRVQTRRIARQVADASVMAERVLDVLVDVGARVEEVEARLNKVVGVRRVD